MKAFVLVVALIPLPVVGAGLTVIHDAGGTVALGPLAEASGLTAERARPPAPATTPTRFPLVTPQLAVGDVARRATGKAGRTLPRPLFVVGADRRSLRWLAAHRERLVAVGAAGLLIEAGDTAAYRRVVAAADGLPLAAVPGGDVARLFDLAHYPVLIGPEWFEQ